MAKFPKCRNKGCQKKWQCGNFCSRHALTDSDDRDKRTRRSNEEKKIKIEEGLLEQFKSKRRSLLSKIDSIIRSILVSNKEDLSQRLATRVLYCIDSESWGKLQPHLLKITKEARDCTSFSFDNLWVGGPSICVAPPVPRIRQKHHVDGSIHQDMETDEGEGVYVFSLCINDVTKKNGAIEIWRESIRCECHQKHPDCYIPDHYIRDNPDIPSRKLTGKKGTVFIWDS